ncbi:MAG: cobyric acid synthase, partial [Candidatus Binataceae bacterium]
LDLLCIPGAKNTVADLLWLRESGWDRAIAAHYHAGGSLLGICGGYQMLGRRIADPRHVESSISEAAGLGVLAVETVFAEKITALVRARDDSSGLEVSGYEIHCGRVTRLGEEAAFRIRERDGRPADEPEGALSSDGRVLGTSIHGLFDQAGFRRHYLGRIRKRKGLMPLEVFGAEDAASVRMRAYDRLADLLVEHLDIAAIATAAGFNLSRTPLGRIS